MIELREDPHFPGRALLEAYGNGGFRFADMSHRGSILVLPSGIRGWSVAAPAEMTEEAFARVIEEAVGIELLIVGTGKELVPLPPALRARLREAGMAVEVMATAPAARTYNVLISDERRVAAALIAVD